jgi:hypothetical protein
MGHQRTFDQVDSWGRLAGGERAAAFTGVDIKSENMTVPVIQKRNACPKHERG